MDPALTAGCPLEITLDPKATWPLPGRATAQNNDPEPEPALKVSFTGGKTGKFECRVAPTIFIDSTEFVSCKSPFTQKSFTADGTYRFDVREKLDPPSSVVKSMTFYVHDSLNGATRCIHSALTDKQILDFVTSVAKNTDVTLHNTMGYFKKIPADFGATQFTYADSEIKLNNSDIQYNVALRFKTNISIKFNDDYFFSSPPYGMFTYFSYSAVDAKQVLTQSSLRRRFVLSDDKKLLLIARDYASEHKSSLGCQLMELGTMNHCMQGRKHTDYNNPSCKFHERWNSFLRVSPFSDEYVYRCDFIVLDAQARGLCLQYNQITSKLEVVRYEPVILTKLRKRNIQNRTLAD